MGTHSPPGSRGQLYLDFVVGIGVFVLALAFVLSVAPGMFSAFDDDPSRPLVADRTADRLAGPMLGADRSQSALNATCVGEFFTRSGEDCGFDHGAAVADRVGIDSRYRLNVTLARPVSDTADRELLCFDGGYLVPCSSGSALSDGEPLPAHDTTTTTSLRTVHVDGRDATLVVRVW
jgi:hypothetical protein